MIIYTISQDGTYIADRVRLNGTTKGTEAVNPCGKEGILNYENKSTYIQDTDGNYTISYINSSQDNGPTKCPEAIGGYTRCNKTVFIDYAYYSTNGRRTVGFFPTAKSDLENIKCTEGQIKQRIYDIPEKGDIEYKTTVVKQAKTDAYLTTANSSTNVYSYSTVNSTKIKRYITKIENFTVNSFKKNHIIPQTSLINEKSNTTVGYKDKDGDFSPGLGFNYVNTVVILTDSNILWYRTANNFPEDGKNFSDIYKSTQKKDKENVTVTVKFIKPKMEEGKVANYDCNSFDDFKKGSKIDQEIKKAKYTVLTQQNKESVYNEYSKQTIPIKTTKDKLFYLTTSTQEFNTKTIPKFVKIRTTNATYGFVSTYKIQASNLIWYGTMASTYKGQKSDPAQYSYYTHGECIDNEVTRKDYVNFRYRIHGDYSFVPNAAFFQGFTPNYIQGQVTPQNLTSFVQNAVLEGGKTFKNIDDIGSYGVSVLPDVIIPIPQISPTFTVDEDSKTINFTRKISAVEVSYSTVENKKTVDKVTNYKWEGNGKAGSTVINALYAPNQVGPSIGNPNLIFNSVANIGKYRNDKTEQSFLTRFVAPGHYLEINQDGRVSKNFEAAQSFNENEKLYLPINSKMNSIQTFQANPVNPGNITYTHSILGYEAFFNL